MATPLAYQPQTADAAPSRTSRVLGLSATHACAANDASAAAPRRIVRYGGDMNDVLVKVAAAAIAPIGAIALLEAVARLASLYA